jgi:hypothetical protein
MTTLTTKKFEQVKLSAAQTKALNKLPSKSAKIRYLTSLDWSRGQIAEELSIQYEHVRNIQITPLTGNNK